jgi:hypothetical protein
MISTIFFKNKAFFYSESRIITSEKMITLPELCNRWRGATQEEILIEESSGRLLPYSKEKSLRLPNRSIQHWLQPSRIPTYRNFDYEYIRSDDRDCLFLLSNIEDIERHRPGFLYENVDIEVDAEDYSATPCAHEERIEDTQADTQEQNTEQEGGGAVTVNQELWKRSMQAGCAALVQTITAGSENVTKEEFRNTIRQAAERNNTHTIADEIAWKALPDKYKKGAGRPKKNA